MKASNDNNEKLNADAIYAGMVWLREYAESPQGQQKFRTILENPNVNNDWLKEVAGKAGGSFFSLPKIDVSDELKEEIYPGEPISVEVGIGFARNVLWGSPNFAIAILQKSCSEFVQRAPPDDEAIRIAMSRFIADRAN